jgi:hypothetical protein
VTAGSAGLQTGPNVPASPASAQVTAGSANRSAAEMVGHSHSISADNRQTGPKGPSFPAGARATVRRDPRQRTSPVLPRCHQRAYPKASNAFHVGALVTVRNGPQQRTAPVPPRCHQRAYPRCLPSAFHVGARVTVRPALRSLPDLRSLWRRGWRRRERSPAADVTLRKNFPARGSRYQPALSSASDPRAVRRIRASDRQGRLTLERHPV